MQKIKIFKKVTSLLICAAMLFTLIPSKIITVRAADATVSTFADLQSAIAAAPQDGTAYTIAIDSNITLTNSPLVILPLANITLTSADVNNPNTILQTNYARHFQVMGNLTISDIIIEGNGSTSGNINGGIEVDGGMQPDGSVGKLIMNDGAIIRKCSADNSKALPYPQSGGGVDVNGGIFEMNGGEISANTAINGAGVFIATAAITLDGQTAPDGSFTMNGGTISGNGKLMSFGGVSIPSGNGSGVFIDSGGTFNMNGGEISNNIAATGGGVCNYGTLTMNGGKIIQNTGATGGGVYTNNTFTMENGEISSNTANSGGGIYNAGTSNITSGTLSNNTANGPDTALGSGGGIYTSSFAKLTVANGVTFSDNTAPTLRTLPLDDSNSDLSTYTANIGNTVAISAAANSSLNAPAYNNYDINYSLNNSYLVTFNSNGGSAVEPQAVVADNNTSVTQPTDPTLDNNTFIGWYADSDLTIPYDFTSPVTSNITLYAMWEANPSPTESPTMAPTPTPEQYTFEFQYRGTQVGDDVDFEVPAPTPDAYGLVPSTESGNTTTIILGTIPVPDGYVYKTSNTFTIYSASEDPKDQLAVPGLNIVEVVPIDDALVGSGTAADPYIISTQLDWDTICDMLRIRNSDLYYEINGSFDTTPLFGTWTWNCSLTFKTGDDVLQTLGYGANNWNLTGKMVLLPQPSNFTIPVPEGYTVNGMDTVIWDITNPNTSFNTPVAYPTGMDIVPNTVLRFLGNDVTVQVDTPSPSPTMAPTPTPEQYTFEFQYRGTQVGDDVNLEFAPDPPFTAYGNDSTVILGTIPVPEGYVYKTSDTFTIYRISADPKDQVSTPGLNIIDVVPVDDALVGSGTADDPYIISTQLDWDRLCDMMRVRFSNEYYEINGSFDTTPLFGSWTWNCSLTFKSGKNVLQSLKWCLNKWDLKGMMSGNPWISDMNIPVPAGYTVNGMDTVIWDINPQNPVIQPIVASPDGDVGYPSGIVLHPLGANVIVQVDTIALGSMTYTGAAPKEGIILDSSAVEVLDVNGNTVDPSNYDIQFVVDGTPMPIGDYTPTTDDVGKAITVQAVAKDGSGYSGTVSENLDNVIDAPSPTPTMAPTPTPQVYNFEFVYRGQTVGNANFEYTPPTPNPSGGSVVVVMPEPGEYTYTILGSVPLPAGYVYKQDTDFTIFTSSNDPGDQVSQVGDNIVQVVPANTLIGSGTVDNPYILQTQLDWDTFCDIMRSKGENYYEIDGDFDTTKVIENFPGGWTYDSSLTFESGSTILEKIHWAQIYWNIPGSYSGMPFKTGYVIPVPTDYTVNGMNTVIWDINPEYPISSDYIPISNTAQRFLGNDVVVQVDTIALGSMTYTGAAPKEGIILDSSAVEVLDVNGNTVDPSNYDIQFVVDGTPMPIGDYTPTADDVGKAITVQAVANDGSGYTGTVAADVGTVAMADPTTAPAPTEIPTETPSPTMLPTEVPATPTLAPSPEPTDQPTEVPTLAPSPTDQPTEAPTEIPTETPTVSLSPTPTDELSATPSAVPLNSAVYVGPNTIAVNDTLLISDIQVTDIDGNLVNPDNYNIEFIVDGVSEGIGNCTILAEDLNKTIEYKVTAKNGYSGTLQEQIGTVIEQNADATPSTTIEPTLEPTLEPIPTTEPTLEPTLEPTPTTEPLTTPTVSPTPAANISPTPTPTLESYMLDTMMAQQGNQHIAYMVGYPGDMFGPARGMTRAEAAVMFSRFLVDQSVLGTGYSGIFSDVPAGTWFTPAIEFFAKQGILQGRDNGLFDPNALITRAEFAAIISRLDNMNASEINLYNDIPSNYWAAAYINSATNKGWFTGYSDGTFRPEANITRAEVVALVNRVFNRHFDATFNQSNLLHFTDVDSSYWAYNDIMEATNAHEVISNINNVEIWK